MSNFFLGLITFAIIVAVTIFIWVMLELRKAIRALKELVNTTENSLKPTVAELQETLKSVRNVADNATVVSGDVRVLSGALRDVGENVKSVSGDMKHLTDFVDGITSSVVVETSGLKAGVKAGTWYFLKNLFK
jgi:methyl-accepting chemotaxis protein